MTRPVMTRQRPTRVETTAAAETTEAPDAPADTTADTTAPDAGGDVMAFDANGDGEVRIGIAAAGPAR